MKNYGAIPLKKAKIVMIPRKETPLIIQLDYVLQFQKNP